jgi:hypothetical protein
VEVAPTALEGPVPSLTLKTPAKSQVIPAAKAGAFEIKLTVKGWKIGENGNHLCLVFDRRPCFRIDDPARPIRLGDLGASLDEGQHVVSILARRGTGELVRGKGKSVPFASSSFFIGKKAPPAHKDGAPMLFFSPPDEGPAPPEGVLIDFFLANAEMGDTKYVVHASVGGPGIETGVGLSLHDNRPMRLKGARAGEYLARVKLMRFEGELGQEGAAAAVALTAKPVPGPFGEITRTFRVSGAR